MDKKGDIGLMEDLCYGLRNLISIEDHAATSYGMDNNKRWLE